MLIWFYRAAQFSANTARFIFETFRTPSDGTYDIGHMKFDIDMKEEKEVNVQTEKVIGSGEEKCIDIKDEEGLHSEEEDDMDVQEEVNIEKKDEVRMRIHCNIL